MKKSHRNPYWRRRTASPSLPTPKNLVRKAGIKVASYLLIAFIGAAVSYFVWPAIMNTIDVKLFGQSKIMVNINEIHPLENEQQLGNFYLVFGTRYGLGTIVAAQVGQPDLNKLFGNTPIPVNYGINGNNLEYSIIILNNGTRKARDIKITFSGDTLKVDDEVDVDKKFDFINYGGFGNQYFCELRKSELAPNDMAIIFVKAKTPSIADVTISAKGNYDSFVNFRKFYARTIVEGASIQMFLDKNIVADLPPLNKNSNFIMYYYSPQETRWIPIENP